MSQKKNLTVKSSSPAAMEKCSVNRTVSDFSFVVIVISLTKDGDAERQVVVLLHIRKTEIEAKFLAASRPPDVLDPDTVKSALESERLKSIDSDPKDLGMGPMVVHTLTGSPWLGRPLLTL